MARSATAVQRAIANLDLKDIVRRTGQDHNWSPAQARDAEKWYRRFLWLIYKAGRRPMVAISSTADDLWHSHIAFTVQYSRDMKKVFGGYLHHTPLKGRPTRKDLRDFELSKQLYLAEYGALPEVVFIRCKGKVRHIPDDD